MDSKGLVLALSCSCDCSEVTTASNHLDDGVGNTGTPLSRQWGMAPSWNLDVRNVHKMEPFVNLSCRKSPQTCWDRSFRCVRSAPGQR